MTQFAYFDGRIVPIDEANISIMNLTFNYGIGCFGGLRGYWNEAHRQLYVFRIHDHYRRFLQSAGMLMADLTYSIEELAQITVELLSHEAWEENCYIRPLAYKAEIAVGSVRLHDLNDAVAIFSVGAGRLSDRKEGLRVGVSSWRRVDDMAIPARGKFVGSYINSAFTKSEALLNGFDEALVLDNDGHVAEVSVANFMMVRNGVLITPPVHSNILEGITRRTLLYLAQEEFGLEIEERSIDRTEVYVADEAFVCGTGMQMSPIISVDHRQIGNGEMGPTTKLLSDLYFRIVLGEEPKYAHWLTPVPQLETAN